MTNRRKRNPINEKKFVQNLMRQIVDAIQPLQSGITHNSPIRIDREGCIVYEVVQDYIASKNECCFFVKG